MGLQVCAFILKLHVVTNSRGQVGLGTGKLGTDRQPKDLLASLETVRTGLGTSWQAKGKTDRLGGLGRGLQAKEQVGRPRDWHVKIKNRIGTAKYVGRQAQNKMAAIRGRQDGRTQPQTNQQTSLWAGNIVHTNYVCFNEIADDGSMII
jgi:hypothetical protein